MKQINIKRDGTGKVTFDTVSIDTTENVFFTNLDPKSEHWPTFPNNQPFATNTIGAAPSANSSQCIVPAPTDLNPPKNQVTYGCKIAGHGNEKGIINVFAPLAAETTDLAKATKNKAIAAQQVVSGGMPPYVITGQQFQVTDKNGNVINSGTGVGPGMKLVATGTSVTAAQTSSGITSTGIWITGAPTVSGTYNFTFNVDDAMGRNLQQTQYEMVVA